MKHTKRILSLLLALTMVLAMAITASAQTVEYTGTDKGSAKITIKNAAKGEEYKVVKLFGATVTGETDGAITYSGTIPESLTNYFEVEGNTIKIKATDGNLSTEAIAAMKSWAESQAPTASATSDGTELEFTSLPYGYYVVLTSQGNGVITVTSTNPNATVYDKNSKVPTADKTVNDDDVYIGETVTYTATFDTANYSGTGETAKVITKYEITDTLPNFLTDVTVTKLVVKEGDKETEIKDSDDKVPQFNNKAITLDWATASGSDPVVYTSKYKNGAQIILTYTAKVTNDATIGGMKADATAGTQASGGNTNKVTLQPYTGDDKTQDKYEDSVTVYTYAAALKKVEKAAQGQEGKALAGAKFSVKGLTVTGKDGRYVVTAYDTSESAVAGTVMDTDSDGQLIIYGLPSDATLSVTETDAPAGYVKLTEPFNLTPQKTSETTTITVSTSTPEGSTTTITTVTSAQNTQLDAKVLQGANKVENTPGSLLPSTGGVGTTLFYIIGAILVLGAGVLLVTKKRMSAKD